MHQRGLYLVRAIAAGTWFCAKSFHFDFSFVPNFLLCLPTFFLQTEFFNNYLRDLDRPGQENSTTAPSHSASPGGAIVHLDERAAVSPGGPSTPGSWGQPPHMMFPRG